jgi:hypothetical protein
MVPVESNTIEKQKDQAYQTDILIRQCHFEIERLSLPLAKALYEMEEQKLYENLGYKSFNAYLADPEVGIARSTAYKLKGIYKDLILNQSIQTDQLIQIGQDKLDIIRKYIVQQPALTQELLADARTLSKTDLRKQIRDKFNDQEIMRPVIMANWERVAEHLFEDFNKVLMFYEKQTDNFPSIKEYKDAKKGVWNE